MGTGLRYLTGMLAVHWLGAGFPYGTLAVNLAGAFLIGLLQQLAAGLIPEAARLFLVVGVLGGMTTYSAFAYETVRLMTARGVGQSVGQPGGHDRAQPRPVLARHGDRADLHRADELDALARLRALTPLRGSARVRAHVATARGAPRAALRLHPMAAHG